MIGKYLRMHMLVFVVALLSNGCIGTQDEPVSNHLNTVPTPEPLPARVQSSTLVNGGRSYRKEDGWKIPVISVNKAKKYKLAVPAPDGRSKMIEVAQVDFDETQLTTEPYAAIGSDLGTLRFHGAFIYSFRGKTFCYKFEVTRVASGGMLFFFAYYDEDGDGLFETAILDEIGTNGRASFLNPPHLPEWILH